MEYWLIANTGVFSSLPSKYDATSNIAYKVAHNPPLILQAGQAFKNPPEAPKTSKESPLELKIDYTAVKYLDNKVILRTYNGNLIGPTIRVNPGEDLHIKLINNLSPKDSHAVTNLHTHGLHVSPSDNQDNIFLEVAAKGSQSYSIAVPNNQYRGTQWYHPHVHGNTSFQVAQGMEGALIVNDEPTQIPPSLKVTENILVIQNIPLGTPTAKVDDAIVVPTIRNAASGNGQTFFTVNGQLTPVITMNQGEVQRWRIVNATPFNQLNLALGNIAWNEIALDGMYLGTVDTWTTGSTLTLQPGNRTDVLVKAPDKCTTATDCPPVQLVSGTTVIANVNFSNSGTPMSLPTAAEMKPLKTWQDIDTSKISTTAQVADFESGFTTPCAPNVALKNDCINGVTFNASNPPTSLALNTTQGWNLSTPDGPADTFPHVFHIHVNPFQTVRQEPNGAETVWLDTLGIPALTPKDKPIQVWTRYENFTGKSVFHCHVLPHEDSGMMQAIDIEPITTSK